MTYPMLVHHDLPLTKEKKSHEPEVIDFLLRLAAAEARDEALAQKLHEKRDLHILASTFSYFVPEHACFDSIAHSSCDYEHGSATMAHGNAPQLQETVSRPPITRRSSRLSNSLSAKAARLMQHVKRPKVKREQQRRASCGQAPPRWTPPDGKQRVCRRQRAHTTSHARPRAAAVTGTRVLQGQPPALQVHMPPPKRGEGIVAAASGGTADPLSRIGYKSLGPIASGAFSTVVKAKHTASGQEVAIKLFECSRAAKLDAHLRDRELHALRHVQGGAGATEAEAFSPCPFIANLLAVHATHASSMVAVLELCRGGSLQRHLHKLRGKPREPCGAVAALPSAEAASYGSQIARALAHLHARDVVHRDVKPANILFFGPGHLKLCDFGFARYCAADATSDAGRCHTVCGTPIHMAPELARHSAVSAKGYAGRPVDVWALGTVLFEMVHNEPAFTASSGEQLYQRIRACAHAPFRADLPREWRELLRACLTVQPTRRPTAEKLGASPILAGADRLPTEPL